LRVVTIVETALKMIIAARRAWAPGTLAAAAIAAYAMEQIAVEVSPAA
jgi:hypothetical protein